MYFCTVCDIKYLHKGLAMYQSLRRVCPEPFTLYWLCLDKEILAKLTALNFTGVELFDLAELEERSIELQHAKRNPPSKYGDAWSQYCWACTPYFINHLLHTKGFDTVLYVDADIYFYHSPQIILDVVGSKAVGIHTHRFTGKIESQPKLPDGIGTAIDTGWYNVGVLAFKNNQIARMVAQNWKNWMIKSDHKYYTDYGKTGDQKYVELFIPLFGAENICVFDVEGNICHQAPWCTEGCGTTPVLFYHFSHFNFDLAAGTWKDHNNEPPEWVPSLKADIRPLYDQYFEAIKEAEKLISGL